MIYSDFPQMIAVNFLKWPSPQQNITSAHAATPNSNQFSISCSGFPLRSPQIGSKSRIMFRKTESHSSLPNRNSPGFLPPRQIHNFPINSRWK